MKRHLQQRLKIRHLRVIDAIISHESILQAAKTLGLSQPALTKSLHDVEEVVGGRLFERHTRGVTATPYGLEMAAAARAILIEVNRLEDALDGLDGGDGGPVVVGALPVTAAGLLPGALARFQAARPEIEVKVVHGRTEDLLSSLALRQVDCVIGRLYEPPKPDNFIRQALYDEKIAVIARADHAIFQTEVRRVADLARFTLVLPTVSQRVGQEIDEVLKTIGITPHLPLRSSSMSLIRETLFTTDSITVMPQVMLIGDILRGTLRILALPNLAPPRPAGIIKRGDAALLRNASLFADMFKNYAQEVQKSLSASDEAALA